MARYNAGLHVLECQIHMYMQMYVYRHLFIVKLVGYRICGGGGGGMHVCSYMLFMSARAYMVDILRRYEILTQICT